MTFDDLISLIPIEDQKFYRQEIAALLATAEREAAAKARREALEEMAEFVDAFGWTADEVCFARKIGAEIRALAHPRVTAEKRPRAEVAAELRQVIDEISADVAKAEEPARPVANCGHVSPVDGCCTHDGNPHAPECHDGVACPMKTAPHSRSEAWRMESHGRAETAAQIRERLGGSPLTDEQQRENLEANMEGAKCPECDGEPWIRAFGLCKPCPACSGSGSGKEAEGER